MRPISFCWSPVLPKWGPPALELAGWTYGNTGNKTETSGCPFQAIDETSKRTFNEIMLLLWRPVTSFYPWINHLGYSFAYFGYFRAHYLATSFLGDLLLLWPSEKWACAWNLPSPLMLSIAIWDQNNGWLWKNDLRLWTQGHPQIISIHSVQALTACVCSVSKLGIMPNRELQQASVVLNGNVARIGHSDYMYIFWSCTISLRKFP